MRRFAPFLSVALLACSFVGSSQAQTVAKSGARQSNTPKVTVEFLNASVGDPIDSYRSALAAELERDLSVKLNATGIESTNSQDVELLLTIEPTGNLSSLRLSQGTKDSTLARAAWNAVKNARYAALPDGLNNAGLKISVHIKAL